MKIKPTIATATRKIVKTTPKTQTKAPNMKKLSVDLAGEEKGFFTVKNSDGSLKVFRTIFPR